VCIMEMDERMSACDKRAENVKHCTSRELYGFHCC